MQTPGCVRGPRGRFRLDLRARDPRPATGKRGAEGQALALAPTPAVELARTHAHAIGSRTLCSRFTGVPQQLGRAHGVLVRVEDGSPVVAPPRGAH
eukprot:scaffold23565_cov71-Phaeocystis_antarctica.AAC.10